MFQRGMIHGAKSLFPSFSFVLLQAFLVPLLASEVTNTMFSDCSPTVDVCGNRSMNISYPFRVPSMPGYCGHPSFELTCIKTRSIWSIDIGRVKYRVTYLDYHYQVFNSMNLQFSGDSCPRMLTNTTFDLSLFNYTQNDLNLTLYFNCSPLTLPSNLRNVTCLANNGYQSYYRLPYDVGSQPLAELVGSCSSVILIPMYDFNAAPLAYGRLDFLGVLQYGFDLMWMVGKGWCMECKDSGGVCGYNCSSPNAATCFCPHGNSRTGTCFLKGTNLKKNKRKIIIGLTIGLTGFIMAGLLFIHFIGGQTRFCNLIVFWKKNLKNDQNIEAFLKKHGSLAPKRYMYSDIKKITKNFHDKLGQGGYGTVFKGILSDGHVVAVKVLSDTKENGEEFVNEVASIGKTSHVNIVSLLGFCFEGSKRALIYDFMCNGSLEKFLYLEKTTLCWKRLYEITIGIARGLEYLHGGCNTKIVHFDIKPHNILLDQDFCPKIADFGLAQLCHQKDSALSMAGTRGTIGYIAPEVFSRMYGVVSSKSDVYSYGMVVLEMVGVRKNMKNSDENSSESYFPHCIYEHLDKNEGLQVFDVTEENEEIVRKMILVGLWCIQTLPQNRPPMSRVLDMLDGSINEIQVPPKPYLSSTVQSNIATSSVS